MSKINLSQQTPRAHASKNLEIESDEEVEDDEEGEDEEEVENGLVSTEGDLQKNDRFKGFLSRQSTVL